MLGAVVWVMFTHAEFATYVHATQRRTRTFMIIYYTRLNLVIRHMERHKYGQRLIALKHPLRFVGPTVATFKTQPEEPTNLALRRLPVTLLEDNYESKFMSNTNNIN